LPTDPLEIAWKARNRSATCSIDPQFLLGSVAHHESLDALTGRATSVAYDLYYKERWPPVLKFSVHPRMWSLRSYFCNP
jgi:hypothetical protein